jgi:hypothetical protein
MIEDATLSFDERTFLLDAAGQFIEYVEETSPSADPDDVEMFLQHYGLPNDLIDFTSSFEVAAYFACKDWPQEVGTFAVLLADIAEQRGLHLYDGRALGLVRPTRQHGWAFRCRPGDPSNLKEADSRLNGVLYWFTFDKVVSPADNLTGLDNILDTTGDPWAAQMRNWLQYCQGVAWQNSVLVSKRIAAILRGLPMKAISPNPAPQRTRPAP